MRKGLVWALVLALGVVFVVGYFLGRLTPGDSKGSQLLNYSVEWEQKVQGSNGVEWYTTDATIIGKSVDNASVPTIDLWIDGLEKQIQLAVDKIPYAILEVGDLVTVTYIYNSDADTIDYVTWERDDQGRLMIVETRPIVVLDAGHGGLDDGEGSNDLWIEKDQNLELTFLMKSFLEDKGIRVIMTREDDTYITLFDRSAIADYVDADMLISNHINKLDGDASGVEVLYGLDSDRDFAIRLAKETAGEDFPVYRVYRRYNDITPEWDYYFLHRYTEVPAYILEYGFADNEEDSQYIYDHWEEMVRRASEFIVEELERLE